MLEPLGVELVGAMMKHVEVQGPKLKPKLLTCTYRRRDAPILESQSVAQQHSGSHDRRHHRDSHCSLSSYGFRVWQILVEVGFRAV